MQMKMPFSFMMLKITCIAWFIHSRLCESM